MSADFIEYIDAEAFEVLVLELELPEPELDELTASERVVALLAADGLGNGAIAARRRVSDRTVANQLHRIFSKLGVSSRWELALLLARRGLHERVPAPRTECGSVLPPPDGSGIRNSALTVQVLAEAHARFGIDFEETRRNLGIELLPSGELPREHYCALFEQLTRMTDRPALGCELARSLPSGSLGLFEWLTSAAPTLGEGLRAASLFGGLLHPGGQRRTTVEGERVTMAYSVPGLPSPRATIDWSFGYLVHRARERVGRELAPLELRVEHAAPADDATERFFGCPVRYGAETNAIVFARETLDLEVQGGDQESFTLLATIPSAAAPLAARSPFERAVWRAIEVALERGIEPRIDRVARRLQTSPRTLQRRLATTGTRFGLLVSSARMASALRRLANGHSVAAIERELDASADAPFRRALRGIGELGAVPSKRRS